MLTQELLVLEADSQVRVYSPRTFPKGTPIGPDAKRLRIVGKTLVCHPTEMTRSDFESWCRVLAAAGYAVTLEPFWTHPPVSAAEALEADRQGRYRPLKEAFDELLREAERRSAAAAQPTGAVESRHP